MSLSSLLLCPAPSFHAFRLQQAAKPLYKLLMQCDMPLLNSASIPHTCSPPATSSGPSAPPNASTPPTSTCGRVTRIRQPHSWQCHASRARIFTPARGRNSHTSESSAAHLQPDQLLGSHKVVHHEARVAVAVVAVAHKRLQCRGGRQQIGSQEAISSVASVADGRAAGQLAACAAPG